MNGRYFLDTNVFIYSFDTSARRKRRTASKLIAGALRDGQGIVSFQVIEEFCSAATRRFSKPLTTPDLREYVEKVFVPLCEIQSGIELYLLCLNIREQTGYSFCDSLILAAAAGAGCETLYTEDLQDGQSVAGVRISNPF